MSDRVWRKCGTCKKEILLGSIYQKCSVSTCHKLVFCSVDCWDEHVPVMNHKSAWAEENRAPSTVEAETKDAGPSAPRRIMVSSSSSSSSTSKKGPEEILIVASKLKAYVKEVHDLNTSADVMDKLSHLVRQLANQAAENARQQGRKTLMDRDFPSSL